jgi:hypothetical protein
VQVQKAALTSGDLKALLPPAARTQPAAEPRAAIPAQVPSTATNAPKAAAASLFEMVEAVADADADGAHAASARVEEPEPSEWDDPI